MSVAIGCRDAGTRLRLAAAAAAAAVGAGVVAVLCWRFGWSAALPAYLVFGAAATAVSATDIACRRIPNKVTVPALLSGVALLAAASGASGQWWPFARAGIAALLLAGCYLVLGLAAKGGMGMGDVKWAAVVGLYCGWLGWRAVFDATILAFAAAATFVLARHLADLVGRRAVVPMAPFMAAGALAAILLIR